MNSSTFPLSQLALGASLCGSAGQAFALRPSLQSTAWQMVIEQWRERKIAEHLDPLQLTLVRPFSATPSDGCRLTSLAQALIERFCQGATLNLSAGQDFLTLEGGAEYPQAVDVDLHALEELLNESGPLLIEQYKQQLATFWSDGPANDSGRWQWFAEHLRGQLQAAGELAYRAGELDMLEAATAHVVALYPSAEQRRHASNLANIRVFVLNMDLMASQRLDPELSSAVLIERHITEQQRDVVLLFTLAGGVSRFDSRQALVSALANAWTAKQQLSTFELNLYEPSNSIFEAQALMLFEQQLRLIDAAAAAPSVPLDLVAQVDQATSMLDICSLSERQKLLQIQNLMPQWLLGASSENSRLYTDGLLKLAMLQNQPDTASFLEGIPLISDYASQALQAAIAQDHPQAEPLDVGTIEIVNGKVTAAAVATGGQIATQGTVENIVFTLPQLALENLNALRAGSITLRRRDGQPLPGWLTEDYVKTLITRLDIGRVYPDLLQRNLLDDPAQALRREKVFAAQLRLQLPLLALEKHLQGIEGISAQGVRMVSSLFMSPTQGPPISDQSVLRPLAFKRQPDAVADVARNVYLIEPRDTHQGPCILYRPLHRQSLREFGSRQALFEALSEPGVLQNDLLDSLEEGVRPVYARGGFLQPHTVRFGLGAEFAPIRIPPPAQLDTAQVQGDLLHAIYTCSARELVARAQAQSVSNSENRWISYKELGWLMFNMLLPLFSGPVATSGWMLQLFDQLQSTLQSSRGDEASATNDLAELLFNLTLIMFIINAESDLPKIGQARPSQPQTAHVPKGVQVIEQPITSPSGLALANLNFSWANPRNHLSAAQRVVLNRFKVERPAAELGQPVLHGSLQGLYLHEQQLWTVIDDAVYRVGFDGAAVRVVDSNDPEHPGPWLKRSGNGLWQFDLDLKLRGGMPLGRRIAEMRQANQQRVQNLEAALQAYLPQRLEMTLSIRRELDEIVAQGNDPAADLMARFGSDLRAHYAAMTQAHENYKALNALKSQADFKKVHARYLADRASALVQLNYALRCDYLDVKKEIKTLASPEGEDRIRELVTNPGNDQYKRFFEAFERARGMVDELIVRFETMLALTRELRQTPPLGADLAAKVEALQHREPPLKAWRSTEIHLYGALLLHGTGGRSAPALVSVIESARLGLQMEVALEQNPEFTERERVQILDSSLRRLTIAQEGLENYKRFAQDAKSRPLYQHLAQVLAKIRSETEAELARHIRGLPQHSSSVLPANRTQTLIKTRNRGMVIGQRRGRAESGQGDMVVVVDPIEGQDLARFEENPSDSVWEPVAQAPRTIAADTSLSLKALLERSIRLLTDADQQIQTARAQARTANIPVEMEEILTLQARPLDEMVQQIEGALTRTNATDKATPGGDAALQAKALTDKAAEMREEGRRLRIAIIKAQPPTASRIDYLKGQGEVTIASVAERTATARQKGKPQDYLQEYVIKDKAGKPLWYAHFHYPAIDAQAMNFTAAHLKTVAQRFDGGQQVQGRDNRTVISVYRSQIDTAQARALFIEPAS
ncbi:hypothetical protein NVV94_16650 [Pseudomonas sp. LS1212]|uniref:dermonecrotic toxin domain-containing protein n=1 Tax=Pseudomonas sp. LS1212 TaxID=2972478 RepID=UPI00215BB17E|nr:DUF6543 domain-containing protein [Pseudomonas sp. LS1212]UVJ42270.1 hypothetical protein NVV94_16650 [Pseudomonas sp. LS1212]